MKLEPFTINFLKKTMEIMKKSWDLSRLIFIYLPIHSWWWVLSFGGKSSFSFRCSSNSRFKTVEIKEKNPRHNNNSRIPCLFGKKTQETDGFLITFSLSCRDSMDFSLAAHSIFLGILLPFSLEKQYEITRNYRSYLASGQSLWILFDLIFSPLVIHNQK